ncbi:MAG: hypothetical protein AB7N91_10770 [Candidatus Tectimicrobiota bacterium]
MATIEPKNLSAQIAYSARHHSPETRPSAPPGQADSAGAGAPWQMEYSQCSCAHWAASGPDFMPVEGVEPPGDSQLWRPSVHPAQMPPISRPDHGEALTPQRSAGEALPQAWETHEPGMVTRLAQA